jgi:hypothetical protein
MAIYGDSHNGGTRERKRKTCFSSRLLSPHSSQIIEGALPNKHPGHILIRTLACVWNEREIENTRRNREPLKMKQREEYSVMV